MKHKFVTQSERIAHALRESGLKQADIVRATGATRSAVSQWLNGVIVRIGAEHLFAIADITGFDARWLATGEGQPLREGDARKKALDQIYARLDDRGKQAVLRVAESESSYSLEPQTKVASGA